MAEKPIVLRPCISSRAASPSIPPDCRKSAADSRQAKRTMPVPLPPCSPQAGQQPPQQQQPEQQQPADAPKLTPAEFLEWQRRKGVPTREAVAAAQAARQQAIRSGSLPLEQLTGRELHDHHPELFDGF